MAQGDTINLNISGSSYKIRTDALLRDPETKLSQMVRDQNSELEPLSGFYFDADPKIFKEILHYYNTGELHRPLNVCPIKFLNQLNFWKIPRSAISECCKIGANAATKAKYKSLEGRPDVTEAKANSELSQVWWFLTDPRGPYTKHKKTATVWLVAFLSMTLIQTLIIAYITTPASLNQDFGYEDGSMTVRQAFLNNCWAAQAQYDAIPSSSLWQANIVLQLIFISEIIVRLITCPAKKYFFTSFHLMELVIACVELSSVTFVFLLFTIGVRDWLCVPIGLITPITFTASSLRVMKIISISVKLSNRMKILALSIWSSWKDIAFLIVIILTFCLVSGPIIYYAEIFYIAMVEDSKPLNIDSIMRGYWWSVVTMTTLGYGDYYPVSPSGYLVAGLIITLGIIITALPIAIIGSNFAEQCSYMKTLTSDVASHSTEEQTPDHSNNEL